MTGAHELQQASELIYGDRSGSYGKAREDFGATAEIWTAILRRKGMLAAGAKLDAHAVALLMVGLKLSREAHKPKADNRIDGCGYMALAGDVLPEKAKPASAEAV